MESNWSAVGSSKAHWATRDFVFINIEPVSWHNLEELVAFEFQHKKAGIFLRHGSCRLKCVHWIKTPALYCYSIFSRSPWLNKLIRRVSERENSTWLIINVKTNLEL